MADAAAIALGEQMYSEMLEQAMQSVARACAEQGESLSDDEMDGVQLGIAAGVMAAMQVLVDRGFLPGAIQRLASIGTRR